MSAKQNGAVKTPPARKRDAARVSRGSTARASNDEATFPAHDGELDALARIEGQLRGIQKMIEDRRYCVDILTQTRSIHAALRRVERSILETHLRTCVQRAMCAGDAEEREQKMAEILRLFDYEPRSLT